MNAVVASMADMIIRIRALPVFTRYGTHPTNGIMIRQLVIMALVSSILCSCSSERDHMKEKPKISNSNQYTQSRRDSSSRNGPILLLSPRSPGDPVIAILDVRHVGPSWRARWTEIRGGQVGGFRRDGGSCSGVRRRPGMSPADVERMRRIVDAACGRPPAGGMARTRGTESDLVGLARLAAPDISPGEGPRERRPERPRRALPPGS